MDIESATEIEAKSNGVPPASRTAAAASRANCPRSELQGVTRPSVEATPMKGLAISASESPSPRRNARCGARSSPSTVILEGSFSATLCREGSRLVLTHDLFDRSAVRQAELGAPARERRLRHRIHDRLQRRIGGEAKLAGRLVLDRIPHLLRTRGNAGEEHRAPRAEGCRRNFGNALQSRHHASKRDARHARARLDRADVVAPRERLAD